MPFAGRVGQRLTYLSFPVRFMVLAVIFLCLGHTIRADFKCRRSDVPKSVTSSSRVQPRCFAPRHQFKEKKSSIKAAIKLNNWSTSCQLANKLQQALSCSCLICFSRPIVLHRGTACDTYYIISTIFWLRMHGGGTLTV